MKKEEAIADVTAQTQRWDGKRWDGKRRAIATALSATILVAAAAFLTASITSEDKISHPALTCFDTSSAILSTISAASCDSGLISLGSGSLLESRSATGLVEELNPTLKARFEAAQIAAEKEGVNLYISSGFRSFQRQSELFADEVKIRGSETEAAKWVLPAQYSHHPEGLAIDINYPGGPLGAKWLEINGYRFGLCRVYANEWWHFEGVIAPGMACPAMSANALVDLAPR